ncbi:Hypothetical predicted protein [Octopus vulgaris]|uniref:Uncharacterized protein n=1 Tax=Octopus vulgaris TaxID=6645 RepID=A0AA36F2Y5_OCTVU|nr:Hypothetical predicted protein [Octopus vulgaris]
MLKEHNTVEASDPGYNRCVVNIKRSKSCLLRPCIEVSVYLKIQLVPDPVSLLSCHRLIYNFAIFRIAAAAAANLLRHHCCRVAVHDIVMSSMPTTIRY